MLIAIIATSYFSEDELATPRQQTTGNKPGHQARASSISFDEYSNLSRKSSRSHFRVQSWSDTPTIQSGRKSHDSSRALIVGIHQNHPVNLEEPPHGKTYVKVSSASVIYY